MLVAVVVHRDIGGVDAKLKRLVLEQVLVLERVLGLPVAGMRELLFSGRNARMEGPRTPQSGIRGERTSN